MRQFIKPAILSGENRQYLRQVQDLIRRLENNLSKAPEGSIRYIQRRGNVQYYLRMKSQEKSGKYVRKSEKEIIKAHLQKAYEKKALELLKKEEQMLLPVKEGSFELYREKLRSLYSDQPEEVKQFIDPVDVSDDDYAKQWIAMPYERKPIDENMKIYQTNKREYVRSKSELNIANALDKYGIPYKYECPLELKNGLTIHPDFTVLNIHSRKLYYWEHRGMMDDRTYAQNTVKRMKEYTKSGIMLGKNLVITEETLINPLASYEIETIIKQYFI